MAQILLTNGEAQATPAAGVVSVYSKSSDKKIYAKDDTGLETPLNPARDYAYAYRNAAFTTGTDTAVKVPIDTISFDTNTIVDLVNNRITPKKAGYYGVVFRASATATASAQRAFSSLYKNGIEEARGVDITSPAANIGVGGGGSSLLFMNGTTDYLELWIYTNPALSLESFIFTSFLSVVGPM